MILSKDEYDALAKEYDQLSVGSRLTGVDGTVWGRDPDDLWNSHRGIRVNSLALVSYLRMGEEEEASKPKLPSGMTDESPSLFDE